ncbi:MAG: hypothetical protein V4712_07870 [Pseudomonadota bacterium]
MQLTETTSAPVRVEDWIEVLQQALITLLPVAAVEALIDRVEVAQ